MIKVNSLSMHFGKFKALNKVSFEAKSGEILGFLGPNGAGKTTAMRLITSYLFPTSGSVEVEGLRVEDHPNDVRGLIGYLPEGVPLYMDMKVEDYVRFAGQARGLSGKKLKERLDWVREHCQLEKIWKHRIFEISKGFKQRVGLAQALIHDPKVLILDEPTSGLDPIQIVGIRMLIKSLAKNKTVIFSTHILQEAEAIADRIVIINQGELVAQGTRAELEEKVAEKEKSENLDYSLEEIFIKLLSERNEDTPIKIP